MGSPKSPCRGGLGGLETYDLKLGPPRRVNLPGARCGGATQARDGRTCDGRAMPSRLSDAGVRRRTRPFPLKRGTGQAGRVADIHVICAGASVKQHTAYEVQIRASDVGVRERGVGLYNPRQRGSLDRTRKKAGGQGEAAGLCGER